MMSESKDLRIDLEEGDFRIHGLFRKGSGELADSKPLIVFIHGTGVNAKYFDNIFFSIPGNFSALGFDVLNVNRAGYGGNPIPSTATPILDGIPLYSKLIHKAYLEQSNGKGGIVLVGHSLGAATVLSIAAFEGQNLPIIGISALGVIPTKELPDGVVSLVQKDPENLRFVVEPTPESIETFMGPPENLDLEMLVHPTMIEIFEPGLKSELKEWWTTGWFERFANEVAPAIKVPLQFLAAEYEIGWKGKEQGQAVLDGISKLFTNVKSLDSGILLGGGHNFEFSKNAVVLQQRRETFINGLIANDDRDEAEFDHIPLIDFSHSQNEATKPEFLRKLRKAIVNVGFFYVKNTSVSLTIQERLIKKGIELFDLQLDEKLKIEMANSKHFLGYARLGTEITALKADYREQFDFATEVPAPGPEEPLYRNLRGPNQWPDETVIPGFRSALEDYLDEIRVLSESFTSLIAEALDIPPNSFDKYFDKPQQNKLKLVKYPPPPLDAEGKDTQGVGAHQDGSFLTFLLQATQHEGLEVQNKAGAWIKANPIPGTLVINIGRSLSALTGGICAATTHRVNLSPKNFVSPTGEPLGPRYSFPVFQGVKIDLDAKDIDLNIPQHIRDLATAQAKSDAESTFDLMFRQNVGEGVLISRITSHQDVGRRWYPELLDKALAAQKEFAGKK